MRTLSMTMLARLRRRQAKSLGLEVTLPPRRSETQRTAYLWKSGIAIRMSPYLVRHADTGLPAASKARPDPKGSSADATKGLSAPSAAA